MRPQRSARRSNAFRRAFLEYAREAVWGLAGGTVAGRKDAIFEVRTTLRERYFLPRTKQL